MGEIRIFFRAARYHFLTREAEYAPELSIFEEVVVSRIDRITFSRMPILPVAASLLITLSITGCQHGDLARERWAAREAGMRKTARIIVDTERGQSAQLANVLKVIETDIEKDARRSRENGPELTGMLQRDYEHWQSRLHDYPHWIYEACKGDPARMEPLAITLFY